MFRLVFVVMVKVIHQILWYCKLWASLQYDESCSLQPDSVYLNSVCNNRCCAFYCIDRRTFNDGHKDLHDERHNHIGLLKSIILVQHRIATIICPPEDFSICMCSSKVLLLCSSLVQLHIGESFYSFSCLSSEDIKTVGIYSIPVKMRMKNKNYTFLKTTCYILMNCLSPFCFL